MRGEYVHIVRSKGVATPLPERDGGNSVNRAWRVVDRLYFERGPMAVGGGHSGC
jgi:hypothetical protein